ncbi:MAG TPA: XRE family transcriptional regulator, partial [Vulgatibacter sp.]
TRVSGDPVLLRLHDELAAYPAPRAPGRASDPDGVAIPLRLRSEAGVLSFLSTTTVFGTPVDVTLSELAIEAFLPADGATAEAVRLLAGSP